MFNFENVYCVEFDLKDACVLKNKIECKMSLKISEQIDDDSLVVDLLSFIALLTV